MGKRKHGEQETAENGGKMLEEKQKKKKYRREEQETAENGGKMLEEKQKKKKYRREEQETAENGEQKQEEKQKKKKKKKYRREKPWDHDGIDHWHIENFDPSWNEGGMIEISSFSTLFPQYREESLQKEWPMVKSALKEYGIKAELNMVQRSMTVSTTRKTRDPYIIIKARDLMRLLSRSVPAPQAIKILDDDMSYDIIRLDLLVSDKERRVKRRQHLEGPNSATLKDLEIVTGCYLHVQGNTVAAMGSFKSLKQIRRIVEECMLEILDPVCNIEIQMMKNELAKNPDLANENWDRFLPKYKKKSVKQKEDKTKKKKPCTSSPHPESTKEVDHFEGLSFFETGESSGTKKSSKSREKHAEKKSKREQG